jgi:hypothetical protein
VTAPSTPNDLSGHSNGYWQAYRLAEHASDTQLDTLLEQAEDYTRMLEGRLAYWQGRTNGLIPD